MWNTSNARDVKILFFKFFSIYALISSDLLNFLITFLKSIELKSGKVFKKNSSVSQLP